MATWHTVIDHVNIQDFGILSAWSSAYGNALACYNMSSNRSCHLLFKISPCCHVDYGIVLGVLGLERSEVSFKNTNARVLYYINCFMYLFVYLYLHILSLYM